jgi:hypothetical protein
VPAKTAVAIGLALVAALAGFAASTLIGGDGGGGDRSADARALARSNPLRGIVAQHLPGFRCAVTTAPAGAGVAQNAVCTPRRAGRAAVTRLTLARFEEQAAMDGLYARARRTSPDPAARRPGDCAAQGTWGGFGRWFDGGAVGGRMFCARSGGGTPAERPEITWTVDDSLVLVHATGRSSADLGAFWLRRRALTNPIDDQEGPR